MGGKPTKPKTTLADVERAYGINNTISSAEVNDLLARTEAQIRFERQDEAARQARMANLQARYNALRYSAVPKRRMRLRKTASKRKSKKTRSQHAKKTEKKGKGVKNYLGNVISNVTDSVKNTGKAVLSPIGKKAKKMVRK
jgi:hypothetical protein